ncbi:terminase large subunit domain-containing protein [Halopelagius fulvigenes]|uniref:Terminase large subunit domain-containing protein n=1 Tax=Halopelagius fulvigenes TaxID=1198324 RepID=A0ABD5TSA4_9EURY
MTTPTEKRLKRDLEEVKGGTDPAAGDVSVEWRDADPEARPDGIEFDADDATLYYDVWGAQSDCLDTIESDDYDLVAFLAGYGAGKSVFGARWLIANALDYPESSFLALGVDFQKARNTTYPKLFQQLPGERTDSVTSTFNGPESSPIVADYNRQSHLLTLHNGSTILLGSADKYSRYAGAEFGAVWADEPSHYGEVLHDLNDMITTRLRGVDGPKTQLWTLTGEGFNAAWEILEKRQDAEGDPIGLDINVLTASMLDNPYLTDGDKERFRRKFEGTGKEQQALHGGFAAATGLVYPAFDRDTHVLPRDEAHALVTDGWRIYGYDAGWNDPRVLLEIGKTSQGQLVVLDEFHESETHVEDAIAWLNENGKPKGTIYAEHEPSEIIKFQQAGYSAVKAEKSIDTGISEVRHRLEVDGEMNTRPKVSPTLDGDGDLVTFDSRPAAGLYVSKECQHLIREFFSYKEEQVGKSTATDHCLDALRYACMGHGKGRPKVPATW